MNRIRRYYHYNSGSLGLTVFMVVVVLCAGLLVWDGFTQHKQVKAIEAQKTATDLEVKQQEWNLNNMVDLTGGQKPTVRVPQYNLIKSLSFDDMVDLIVTCPKGTHILDLRKLPMNKDKDDPYNNDIDRALNSYRCLDGPGTTKDVTEVFEAEYIKNLGKR